ncbi:hypothetical protein AMECASPLE_021562 [Ameca splendens]|uniref:Uncharacterized protein n=1 Tax=Ameca splendens TaxID=208324 RepID=A0ABV0ZNE1_9TELE
MNFPTGPPPTRTQISNTCPLPTALGTPMSFIPEKPKMQHPHSTSSTHSHTPSTPTASRPHHTACRKVKARAPCNTTPASAHRCNRADTNEHQAHNGTPEPTPRWDKLTRQEVLGPASPTTPPQSHRHTTSLPLQRYPSRPPPQTQQPAEQHTAKPAQPFSQSQEPQPISSREGNKHQLGNQASQVNRSRPRSKQKKER